MPRCGDIGRVLGMDEFLMTACRMLPPRRRDGRRSPTILARTNGRCEARALTCAPAHSKIYAAAVLFPIAVTRRIERVAFRRGAFARRGAGRRSGRAGGLGLRI